MPLYRDDPVLPNSLAKDTHALLPWNGSPPGIGCALVGAAGSLECYLDRERQRAWLTHGPRCRPVTSGGTLGKSVVSDWYLGLDFPPLNTGMGALPSKDRGLCNWEFAGG